MAHFTMQSRLTPLQADCGVFGWKLVEESCVRQRLNIYILKLFVRSEDG